MSRTLNEVRLIGRLGKDPVMTYSPTGLAVTKFSLATNHYTRAADGTLIEETDWHNIVAFDKLAETCNQYLRKGSQVFVGGRLQTRSWDKDGQRQYKTEIVAEDLVMLDAKPRQGSPQDVAEAYEEEPAF